ncbi:hypothetical protein [Desulfoluna butyratoxydans]|uniref:Uncharacterized protein n=1 Tax=Desulfoluna butyratoxydans TaxID=231438 RepID=A0A4U8YQ09_9BACT|nr:hypothetical protein [Desulfoluna butyratoxydans]VFQ45901.1 hypothetical protein MSL71_35640 [Desulfoluna butyratoxydans]
MLTAFVVLLVCTVTALVALRLIYTPDGPLTGQDDEEEIPFQVIITPHELSCEHPMREREAVPWREIHEIVLINAQEAPPIPPYWLVFVGDGKGCSVPTEAQGFSRLWDEIEARFPGFDFNAVLEPEAGITKKSVWRKPEVPH